MVELARAYRFFILADDVYHLLDWSAEPPPPRLLAVERRLNASSDSEEFPTTSAASDERACGTGRGGAGAQENNECGDDDDDDDDGVYKERTPGAARGAALWRKLGGAACVLSVSSFTKILAPGLRLGWIEADPALIAHVSSRGYVVSGGCVAPFTAAIVGEALRSGAQAAFLDGLRVRYSTGSAAMVDALAAAASHTKWSFHAPSGKGYATGSCD